LRAAGNPRGLVPRIANALRAAPGWTQVLRTIAAAAHRRAGTAVA
jgi:hypothetical protein